MVDLFMYLAYAYMGAQVIMYYYARWVLGKTRDEALAMVSSKLKT